MSKYCIGCGIELQCEDPFIDGYVNPSVYDETIMCRRCFRLKHYGEYKVTNKSNSYYKSIIKDIFKMNELVIHIVDIFDMGNIDYIYSKVFSPAILVISKIDVIPKSVKEEKIVNYFKEKYKRYIDVIVISSEKNYNMDKLLELIMKNKTSNEVYVLGNTNAGKSSFINKMIKNYTESSNYIVTSCMPSTTLNVISIKINDELTLLDTPGILNEGNIVTHVKEEVVKKISIKEEINPRIYQIKDNTSLLINNIGRIDILNDSNISIYISNNIEADKISFSNNDKYKELNCTKIKASPDEETVIEGLCFIKSSKDVLLNIYIEDGVDIYTRDKII